MQTTYITGRTYGTPQVLRISVVSRGADDFDASRVEFHDDARRISGAVSVFTLEVTPRDIGPAVLREYDGGRYRLI